MTISAKVLVSCFSVCLCGTAHNSTAIFAKLYTLVVTSQGKN